MGEIRIFTITSVPIYIKRVSIDWVYWFHRARTLGWRCCWLWRIKLHIQHPRRASSLQYRGENPDPPQRRNGCICPCVAQPNESIGLNRKKKKKTKEKRGQKKTNENLEKFSCVQSLRQSQIIKGSFEMSCLLDLAESTRSPCATLRSNSAPALGITSSSCALIDGFLILLVSSRPNKYGRRLSREMRPLRNCGEFWNECFVFFESYLTHTPRILSSSLFF